MDYLIFVFHQLAKKDLAHLGLHSGLGSNSDIRYISTWQVKGDQ